MGNKLYVGNLPFRVEDKQFDDGDLNKLFSEFGEVTEAAVVTDKFSGRSRGFGFVTFANDEDAQKAISAMDGKEVGGRALKVNEAKPRDDEGSEGRD
ncbi:RNA-binding protein [Candidatus Pacearchaeota archaeon]|nr:RNA-binding protein [Candidatus Pacearchaeota archaeon]|tara:strand:- start:38 stop:328 length:291 start_codon:yes stop_codon:yes gene_type:complete